MNAIQLLEHQHREIENLFSDIEKCGDDERDKVRRLFAELADKLVAHMEIEEQYFYPAMKLYPGEEQNTEEMVQLAAKEQFETKKILASLLDLEPGSSEFLLELAQLKDGVVNHLEEEESEMFPLGRKLFTRDDLEGMGEEMQEKFE